MIVKTIVTVVILLAVYAIIVSLLGYKEVTDALLDQYAENAFRTAKIAAHFIDPDEITLYEESGGEGEEYETVFRRLTQVCNTSGSTFVYVIEPDHTDYKHITFLFSTMNQKMHYDQYEFGYVRETTNEEYEEKYRRICEEGSTQELLIRDSGYIETEAHITAMIPLTDSAEEVRAILCVQCQMDVLKRSRNSLVGKILMSMICLVVIAIIILILRLNSTVLTPVRVIANEATRFASENVIAEHKLEETIHTQDEIGYLAKAIDQMEEQIDDYVKNLTKITAEKERISTEMTLAAHIQEDMLPTTFPAFPERPDFEIFASMDPAREVGGDFYQYFLIDDDHLFLTVADVSGKGIPAALFMMASIITLANTAHMCDQPSEILRRANEAICATNREEMFVTVWLGILELSTGKLTAANAGHEYPAIYHAGGKFELLKDKHGFVLGGLQDVKFPSYELMLKPGDKIFLYTDGVAEATDTKNVLFGTDRMLDALNQDPGADIDKLAANVKIAINKFVGGAEQFDDMTMVCLEYFGQDHTLQAKHSEKKEI